MPFEAGIAGKAVAAGNAGAPVPGKAGTAGRLAGRTEEATDEGGSETRPLLVESFMSTCPNGPVGKQPAGTGGMYYVGSPSGAGLSYPMLEATAPVRRLNASMADSPATMAGAPAYGLKTVVGAVPA